MGPNHVKKDSFSPNIPSGSTTSATISACQSPELASTPSASTPEDTSVALPFLDFAPAPQLSSILQSTNPRVNPDPIFFTSYESYLLALWKQNRRTGIRTRTVCHNGLPDWHHDHDYGFEDEQLPSSHVTDDDKIEFTMAAPVVYFTCRRTLSDRMSIACVHRACLRIAKALREHRRRHGCSCDFADIAQRMHDSAGGSAQLATELDGRFSTKESLKVLVSNDDVQHDGRDGAAGKKCKGKWAGGVVQAWIRAHDQLCHAGCFHSATPSQENTISAQAESAGKGGGFAEGVS